MSAKSDSGKDSLADAVSVDQYLVKDPERFALNLARVIEEAGKAASAWAEPREKGEVRDTVSEPVVDMVKTLSRLSEYWLSDPSRALEAQTRLFSGYMNIWSNAIRRFDPEEAGKEATDQVRPAPSDKRFQDPEWGRNAFFDFLRQAYLVTSDWAGNLVEHADGLDEATRNKARFYVKQIVNAVSPSNFILTNPELFRETVASNGENLVRGMRMLAEDIEAGHGDLKLRQSDYTRFAVGKNLATTPGKVVARSELAEIIQYEPTTETVLKRPLMICPPWINKFYILDLNPEKSFIRWAVGQGHTVFVISWVNPDERHSRMGWEEYIRDGLLLCLDTIEKATGEREVNAIGYCVGGTLLAAALALMARQGDERIASATFFATQVDFTHAGDLKIFVDEDQVAAIERSDERSRLPRRQQDGDRLQHAALRRPDLALRRQQLHARQDADALRPALLEFELDPDERGQPFLLPAQLLSGEQSQPRAHDARRPADLAVGGEDSDLQSGDARGPHRPCPLRLPRQPLLRRQGRVRADGLGTHRRRRQPSGTEEVSVLDRRAAGRRLRGMGRGRARTSRFVVAALAAMGRGAGRDPGSAAHARQGHRHPRRCSRFLRRRASVTQRPQSITICEPERGDNACTWSAKQTRLRCCRSRLRGGDCGRAVFGRH